MQQPKRQALLDGSLARASGLRSDCIYILHLPILDLALVACVSRMSGVSLLVSISMMTIVGTIIISEIVHRLIELPAIKFGKAIVRVNAKQPPAALPA